MLSNDGFLNLELEERLRERNQAMGVQEKNCNNKLFTVHTKVENYKTMIRTILI